LKRHFSLKTGNATSNIKTLLHLLKTNKAIKTPTDNILCQSKFTTKKRKLQNSSSAKYIYSNSGRI